MFKTLREQKEEVARVETKWQGWKSGVPAYSGPDPDSVLQQDQTQQYIILISISKNSRSP